MSDPTPPQTEREKLVELTVSAEIELSIARGIREIVNLCSKEILIIDPERKAKVEEAVLNIIAAYGQDRERKGEILGRADEWLRLDRVVGFTKKRNKAVYKLQLPLAYVQTRTKELAALTPKTTKTVPSTPTDIGTINGLGVRVKNVEMRRVENPKTIKTFIFHKSGRGKPHANHDKFTNKEDI